MMRRFTGHGVVYLHIAVDAPKGGWKRRPDRRDGSGSGKIRRVLERLDEISACFDRHGGICVC